MGVQVVSAKMEANPTDSLKTIDALKGKRYHAANIANLQ
jgi:hypothetical protein